jgi:hypothetical protein
MKSLKPKDGSGEDPGTVPNEPPAGGAGLEIPVALDLSASGAAAWQR